MRKIVSFTMILVLSFAMIFVYPAKQASANPLAVGGALYLGGAGVYVLGAVGVGAIAGIAGCSSCQEDIEAHAARTWEGSTQLVKDGLQMMIDGSVGAWGATSSALTQTDANFNSWVDSKISSFTDVAMQSKYQSAYMNQLTFDNSSYSYNSGRAISFGANIQGQEKFILDGKHVSSASLLISKYGTRIDYFDSNGLNQSIPLTGINIDYLMPLMAAAQTAQEMIGVFAKSGYTILVANAAGYAEYQASVSYTREAWEDMKDAGLVLPTDNARPMAGNIPLTYDPVSDSYAGIDGVRVPHEDVTGFEYQKPHWKTLEDLAMLGLSGLGAGLYIDGWTGSDSVTSTYNPTTDSTTTTTDTTTTHTNVNTGETVTSTTSTTTTTTGDTTGNPTTGEPPPPSTPSTPTNPFKGKVPGASLLGLWELLVALIWYLIRLITFVATLALIAPTEITNPYFQWFTTVQILGITPYPLVQNLALFFLGFSIYKSVRRVF